MPFTEQLKQAQAHLANLNFPEAMAIYQAILKEEPNHTIALQAMGQIAYKVANFEAAEDYFQKSLTQNPSQSRVWLLLGEVCLKMRKHEKGLQAFKNAAQVNPNGSDPYLKLGTAYSNQGEKDLARRNLEKAFLTDRNSPSAFRLLATLGEVDLESDVARAAKTRLEDGQEDPLGQAHIHYGFAYIFEKLGRSEDFFKHLDEANRLQKSLSQPWLEVFKFNAKSIREKFTPEVLSRGVGEETKQFTPIFIVGMPRSGTTLTEQIVASHPRVYGADEMDTLTNFVVNRITVWTKKPLLEGIGEINPDQLKELSAVYQTKVAGIAPGKDFVTDKFLANYLLIGLIKMIMPWSKVIALKRHPMDVAFSIYRNFFLAQLPYCFDLEDMARFYCLYRDLMEFWQQRLPGFVHTVKYENLVENPEAEAKKIIHFCGLPWDKACANPHENKRVVLTLSQNQVRKPVYKSSIGKWRKYEKELKPFRDMCEKLGHPVEKYD